MLTGLNFELSGRNGAVNVKCSPIATRRAAELSAPSAIASEREKVGAATSADVALRRPRVTRSRMAVLTPGESP